MKSQQSLQFTPWEHRNQQDLDKIAMINKTIFHHEKSNLFPQQPPNSPSMEIPSSNHVSNARQYSYKQKSQPREKIVLKKIEVSSLIGIGKGLVGQISTAKKQIQRKMMEYLLLMYVEAQLKQQQSTYKEQLIKQKYDCLFPLIGINNINKEQYKSRRRSLNDLINVKRV